MQPTILYKSNSKPLIHTHTRFTLSVSFCMTQLELKIVDRKKIHKFKLDPDSKFDCKHSRSVCLSVCFFPYLCKELYLQTNLTIATNRYAQIKNDTTWIQYESLKWAPLFHGATTTITTTTTKLIHNRALTSNQIHPSYLCMVDDCNKLRKSRFF
mgnify:CR=1 FL=1